MKKIFSWCLNINLKNRFISIIILLISVTMSNLAFNALIAVQNNLINADLRFCTDLSIMLSHQITFLIQKNNTSDLKNFIEKLYLDTSFISYVRLFDTQGDLLLSFPMYNMVSREKLELLNELNINSRNFFFDTPIVTTLIDSRFTIVDSFFPLVRENSSFGFLQLGVSSNLTGLFSIKIAQDFSVVIFVSVWLMFILGAAFNVSIVSYSINKLLIGLQGIASGNFSQQINNSAKGELGDLFISFNQMSERLLSYEKKNIAQLISEKSKLEALVATIADGAILLDTELRLLFVNQVAVEVFHWSNKDLIGKIVFKYLPMHVNEILLPILNTMIKTSCLDCQVPQTQEVSIDLHDESLKTFRFLLSTISSCTNQGFNGVVITIQDVTRETQLNEAKSQFVSNVSHELRTPLCNIRSFLETLIDYDYRLTEHQKSKFLAIAHAETQRLNTLVNDVLDLSRLESESSYALSPVVLIDVIFYIIKTSQIIALSKKVQVVTESHKCVGKTLAHENSLCQVLSNLISNSLKFTHEKGKIVIRMYPLPISDIDPEACNSRLKFVRLEIIDEGIGIDNVFQRQIFDRFMRIENNIHTLEGTGLGLSIVKKIIEKHNSLILVYSEIGVGTSFWFDLLIAH